MTKYANDSRHCVKTRQLQVEISEFGEYELNARTWAFIQDVEFTPKDDEWYCLVDWNKDFLIEQTVKELLDNGQFKIEGLTHDEALASWSMASA